MHVFVYELPTSARLYRIALHVCAVYIAFKWLQPYKLDYMGSQKHQYVLQVHQSIFFKCSFAFF